MTLLVAIAPSFHVDVMLDETKLAPSDSQVMALKEIAKQRHEKKADFYRFRNFVRVAMRSAGGGRSPGA